MQKIKKYLLILGCVSWIGGLLLLIFTFYAIHVLANTFLFFVLLFLDFIALTGIFTTITIVAIYFYKKLKNKLNK